LRDKSALDAVERQIFKPEAYNSTQSLGCYSPPVKLGIDNVSDLGTVIKKIKAGKDILVSAFRYVFLCSFCFILLYPLLYIAINSLKSGHQFLDPSIILHAKPKETDN
jgi:hypothetical protein